MRTIGQSMRLARRAKGMTVRELAVRAGVGKSNLYHAEQDLSYPSLTTVVACADVLGITLDEYIGREGYLPKPNVYGFYDKGVR